MNKLLIFLSMVFWVVSLSAIRLEHQGNFEELDYLQLKLNEMQELKTEKIADGKSIVRTWHGIKLIDILKEKGWQDFDRLAFSSEDNYLVRLTKEEIEKNDPLLALYLNNEKLKDNNRLVISNMPAMYWIRDIALIRTEKITEMPQPKILHVAEARLDGILLTVEPEPFKKVSGYYLPQLLQAVFPIIHGEYLLTGRDGVSHILEYDTYLSKAVLIQGKDGFILQSPQMPGGMWIKNIAYIQKSSTAIVFFDQLSSLNELKELLEWDTIPPKAEVYGADQKKDRISTELSLDEPLWQKAQKFTW